MPDRSTEPLTTFASMVIVGASGESVTVHFLTDQPVVEVGEGGTPSHSGNRYRVAASAAMVPSVAGRLVEQLQEALSRMERTA